jgi:hypothetical protein
MQGVCKEKLRRGPVSRRAAGIKEDQPTTKEDPMDIRKYLGTSILSVALLLASALPGFAKDSRAVTLTHNVVLSGTTLSAGQYVVRWEARSPGASVEFARGHKVVLSTEGRFEDRGKKYDYDSVVYDTAADGTMTISEIRFAGSSQVLVFNQ